MDETFILTPKGAICGALLSQGVSLTPDTMDVVMKRLADMCLRYTDGPGVPAIAWIGDRWDWCRVEAANAPQTL